MFRFNRTGPSAPIEELPSSSDLASRRAKLDNERLSRRQVLKKMGIMSGVAVLALLSVDDLARMAAKQLASSCGDSEVASAVARQLRSAGLAYAEAIDDPRNQYWTAVDCQDRTDAALLGALTDKLKADLKAAAKDAIKQCSRDTPGDSQGVTDCFKEWVAQNGGLTGGAGTAEWIKVKQYLECSYLLCDSGHEGSKCCKYGDAQMNRGCMSPGHEFPVGQ